MMTDDEKELWRSFLAAEPAFAGESIGSAIDGPDPPDVLCATLSGKRIGVELATWSSSDRDRLASWVSFEDGYLRIIESANHARPAHIGWVWLRPRRSSVKPEEVPDFREQLYEFLARENSLSDPEWDQPLGAEVSNFFGFPIVADYLDSVWIFPRRQLERLQPGQDWIKFEGTEMSLAPSWVFGAAIDRVVTKIAEYEERSLHVTHSLHELHLVCRCDESLLSADFIPRPSKLDFRSFAARIGNVLADEHGVFNRIFLFSPYEAPRVLQVYPVARKEQHPRHKNRLHS
jgi:hypothetical protein